MPPRFRFRSSSAGEASAGGDDRSAPPPEIFPRPRRARWGAERTPVGRLRLELPSSLGQYREHVRELASSVGTGSDRATLPVRVVPSGTDPEAYELRITRRGVRIGAAASIGVLHAMRTLVDLWDAGDGATPPVAEIADSPSFDVRGVFAESFTGTDRMDLADWRSELCACPLTRIPATCRTGKLASSPRPSRVSWRAIACLSGSSKYSHGVSIG